MSMQLGTLTFSDWVEDEYDLPIPQRSTAYVDTYGGVAFFSWGIKTVGQLINITWDMMSKDLFEDLQDLYVSDTELTWLPGDGYSYQVQMTDFGGTLITTYDNSYRQKVYIKLLITGRTVIAP